LTSDVAMINWQDKIYVALLNSSSDFLIVEVICKIMVCNYTETKMLAPCVVYQTLVLSVQKARNRSPRDVRNSRDGPHARVTGAVSWRQYPLFAVLQATRRRCADPTCGAMTARRFYEPFFTEPRCSFSDDRTNERSPFSASRCRQRHCRNAQNMQRQPIH